MTVEASRGQVTAKSASGIDCRGDRANRNAAAFGISAAYDTAEALIGLANVIEPTRAPPKAVGLGG